MKHITTILLLIISLSTQAAPRDCLILHFADGSYAVVPLEGNPQITFDGAVMQINSERYQFSNIRKYTFADSENAGIYEAVEGSTERISFDKDHLVVHLSNLGQTVRLHTVNGIEIPVDTKADAHGMLRIPIPQAPNQVYLLTIGNETIKIRRP